MRCAACDAVIYSTKEDLCVDCLEVIRLAEKGIEPDYRSHDEFLNDLEIETGIFIPKDEE